MLFILFYSSHKSRALKIHVFRHGETSRTSVQNDHPWCRPSEQRLKEGRSVAAARVRERCHGVAPADPRKAWPAGTSGDGIMRLVAGHFLPERGQLRLGHCWTLCFESGYRATNKTSCCKDTSP